MKQENDSREVSKLREILGQLSKENAPWYFEAQVRQSIASEGKPKSSYLLRPALALPIIAALGALVFYVSVPDLVERWGKTQVDPEISLPNPHDPDARPAARPRQRRQVTEPEASEFMPTDGLPERGPSDSFSDPFIPSTMLAPDAGGGTLVTVPLEPGTTQVAHETLIMDSDTVDTLATPDSLKNR